MDMSDVFNANIHVPTITSINSLNIILNDLKLFNSQAETNQCIQRLNELHLDGKLSVGIRKLIMRIEMARQDVDKQEKFISTMIEEL